MVNTIKFKQFLEQNIEDVSEAKDPKQKRFDQMEKLAGQIGKYGHRWGDNPSARLTGWVDQYNRTKEEFQKEGIWAEYCKSVGFAVSHTGHDCLA
mgnify:CR=1 FL=1